MRPDRLLLGLHAGAVALALAAAFAWPRAGQAARLVPLGAGDLAGVLRWAEAEGAPLLELDTSRGRVVARMTDNRSLLSAVRAGILPLAAQGPGCQSGAKP